MTEHVGGQAVIEGVMMRKENKIATAVRLRSGKIKIKKDRLKKRSKFWKIPFFRGIVALWDMLILGMKTLLWSADQQLDKHEKITKFELFYTLALSLGFGVLFFIVIPLFLAGLVIEKGFWFNLVDGIIRIAVFLIYISLISLMEDVKVLFRYHGAEHKTVHCYEAGKKLTYENIKKFTTLHPRCGTAFIFIVLIISILIFSIIRAPDWYIRLGVRIVFIPVIAGISYEILKLSDRFKNIFFIRWLTKPGLWLQKITTKEPDKKQVEVAIKALKSVL